MPLPFLTLATPVLHSSGSWIASTAAGGYLSGTLASTWIGAFVLGNSGFLVTLSASVVGVGASIVAASTSASLWLGEMLTDWGLGWFAEWLGIAPVRTFWWFTAENWAIFSTILLALLTVTLLVFQRFFAKPNMLRINSEREKGGLEAITLWQVIKEVWWFKLSQK